VLQLRGLKQRTAAVSYRRIGLATSPTLAWASELSLGISGRHLSGIACESLARYKSSFATLRGATAMCRSIKTLFNFAPPATEEEIRDASLQFVRKLSGFTNPSRANRAAFDQAVDEVAASARALIGALVTTAEPRDREIEAERARARSAARFGTGTG
jgi:hypothetical protein